jgi:hypothetical protein
MSERWLVAMAVLGFTASAGAATLGWLLVTRPVALAQFIERML